MTYYIRNWSQLFEVSQSRRVQDGRPLSWVAMPTDQSGKGYRRLLRSEHGPSMFGAWCAIVQLSAKMPKRGTFADQDGALDAADIADSIGFPVDVVSRMLDACMSPKINWLGCQLQDGESLPLREHSEDAPSTVDDLDPTVQDITGQDITEQEEPLCDKSHVTPVLKSARPYTEAFERFWKVWPNTTNKGKAFDSWRAKKCDPHVDTLIEHVERHKRDSQNWMDGYIPHASTWINGGRWEDLFDGGKPSRTAEQTAAEKARYDEAIAAESALILSQGSK